MEDGLYGRDLEVVRSPVLRISVNSFLQHVELSAEARLFKRHPAGKHTTGVMWPDEVSKIKISYFKVNYWFDKSLKLQR